MYTNPDRRGPQSPQEHEWVNFAREYKDAREPVRWNECTDFVMNCLAQLEFGGLTENQWAAAVQDYRLPLWRRYRVALERESQAAARKAAQEVQQRWRDAVRQGPRPAKTQEVKAYRFGGCDPSEDSLSDDVSNDTTFPFDDFGYSYGAH